MSPPTAASATAFPYTRWTRVAVAGGNTSEAAEALKELCAAYYAPVVAFLRSEGRTDDVARELAHAFFEQVLNHRNLGGASAEIGRFRTYLLGAVKHFLANEARKLKRLKRGGMVEEVPLDTVDSEPRVVSEFVDEGLERDACFDHRWAVSVVERALSQLTAEAAGSGESERFEALKPWLSASGAEEAQAKTAERLGMNANAFKVALHRLRKRFRELVRSEIAQTLQAPSDIEDEMQHLIRALALGRQK